MDTLNEMIGLSSDSIALRNVGLAVLALIAGMVAGRVVQRLLARALQQLDPSSLRHAAIDAVSPPLSWALRLLGLWMALRLVPKPAAESVDYGAWFGDLYQAVTIVLATWFGVRVIGEVTAIWARRASGTTDTFDDQLVPVVRKSAKVALVIIGAVMILQDLGYPVGSLLAGLGIGGVALAYASKDTVANFFGSLVVFIDRPFQVGDWIEVGDVEGTVEQIDLRTTRIRTFANSIITVPNSQMTVTAIQNWSRMRKRRIKLNVGLTYATTAPQMRDAVAAIRKIIEDDERFHHDFYLVNFTDLGESSLDIFCYFFTKTTNWAEYMQVREDFLLAVMDAMSERGLSIAFPTRTVHLGDAQPPGAPAAMLRQAPR